MSSFADAAFGNSSGSSRRARRRGRAARRSEKDSTDSVNKPGVEDAATSPATTTAGASDASKPQSTRRRRRRRKAGQAEKNDAADVPAEIGGTDAEGSVSGKRSGAAAVGADAVAGTSAGKETIETVLSGLDDTLIAYVKGAMEDLGLSENRKDVEAAAVELRGSVGPVLLSSEFCNESRIDSICTQLAAIQLRPPEVNDSSAEEPKRRVYEDLPSRRDNDELLRMAALGKSDSRSVSVAYSLGLEDTLDDWMDQNSRQARLRARREEKENEKIAAVRRRLLAEAAAVQEQELEAIRNLPSRLEASSSADSDLILSSITISSPTGQILLENGDVKLVQGRRYGLTGRNGVGKTTMLRAFARRDLPGFPQDLRVLHVSQEVHGEETTVLDTVINSDFEVAEAKRREAELLADPEADQDEVQRVYDLLEALEASTAEARACSILQGLQFTSRMLSLPTRALSGGWRQRVALARALYLEPHLLLLDEPTNHLDLEACLWLEQYLLGYDSTLVIVSHDRRFLNNVCTDILHMHHQKLDTYRGDYDTFEKTRIEAERRQKKAYEAQQRKRDHMQAFVDKFRYNAKRASMAQSRLKALQRMDLIDDVMTDPTFRFEFPNPGELGLPILSVNDVSFTYPAAGSPQLFKKVNFGLDLDCRIGIVGPNGVGKSTLLKLILGQLDPSDGYVSRNRRLRVAAFSQHHVEQLDMASTAIENIQKAFPEDNLQGIQGEERVRAHLGRYGVLERLATKPAAFLSGGQKSRVSFALITWRRPHIIIMDEPTNHLDLETIDALCMAITTFKGGVIVVSHDQNFVESCCEELWEVGNQQVTPIPGGLAQYKKKVQKHMQALRRGESKK